MSAAVVGTSGLESAQIILRREIQLIASTASFTSGEVGQRALSSLIVLLVHPRNEHIKPNLGSFSISKQSERSDQPSSILISEKLSM
jgi:hypothetical protein